MAKKYLENEERMLAILKELEPFLETRAQLEKQEPSLATIRCFEYHPRKLKQAVEKEREEKRKEEEEKKKNKEDRKRAREEIDKISGDLKKRGGPLPKTFTSNLDPNSSGQIL